MELLSEGWDTNNASRPGKAIIEDAVTEYEERIKHGDSPPSVIVIFRANGTVFPLDGRQRLTAAKRQKWSHFNAYVLSETTKRQHIELIEIGANTSTNGAAPVDRSFVYERAAKLHTEYGMSVDQIAKDIGLRKKGIEDQLAYAKELQHLRSKKIPAEAMNKGVVIDLARLNRDWWDEAPKETSEVVMLMHRAKLTNGKVSTFVDRANKNCKGNSSRIAQMRGFLREMLSDSAVMSRLPEGKKRQPGAKVVEHARKFRTVALEAKRGGVQLDDHQTKELVEALAEARQYCMFIVKQGTPV